MQQSKKPPATTLDRLTLVRARIARAARDAGREPQDVTLVCVSKTFAAQDIVPVIGAGERVFGENRVQEALEKWPPLKADNPGLELHLIGPLQSNKTAKAAQKAFLTSKMRAPTEIRAPKSIGLPAGR